MLDKAADLADLGFWRELAPELHIGDEAFLAAAEPLAMPEEELARMEAEVHKGAYTQYVPADWGGLDIGLMAETVKTLRARGLMTPFGFVYDEYWMLFSKVRPYLARMLGEDYKILPDFWIWHVAASDDDAGWGPHRDKGAYSLFADGRPKSLTVWIALTDAVPENGCMYLVPADRDPGYNDELRENEYLIELNNVRALPATAGTVSSWTQAILHWGAHSSSRGHWPRISAAFEFQRADVPAFNQPLIDQGAVPGFGGRLKLIAKQLLQYRHNYTLDPAFEDFAQRAMGNEFL